MYEEFYGFVQSPFTLAPDPRFLYLSESHEEALRLLLQSIKRREGFIVLAGDIGTGKTTLCRAPRNKGIVSRARKTKINATMTIMPTPPARMKMSARRSITFTRRETIFRVNGRAAGGGGRVETDMNSGGALRRRS